MRYTMLGLGLLLALPFSLHAAVKGEEIEYSADGVTLKGYIAYDDSISGKRPGVLVVHEWWGHNAYARQRAETLAEMGYTALAVDMYGNGQQADHPDDAKKFMQAVVSNIDSAKGRFLAGLETLRQQDSVDGDKTAAIGYCFGGGIVLAMARLGVDIDGVASFHGSLGTQNPAQADTVKSKIFVANGEADKMVPPEQVEGFKQEMHAAGVDFEYHGYPGVLHSFTNPDADTFAAKFNMPLAYDAHADKDSWDKLQHFLNRIFAD
jgi:dienelactone hydrolase